jgi:hypothetical protein
VQIASGKGFSIDFHPAITDSNRLVITFTAFGNQILDGSGFGGKFLTENGLDVISVKSILDDWYAGFGTNEMLAIEEFLRARRPYIARATYGSSMGGYAAFRFAKALGASVSLSVSPQYAISADWDTRWASNALRIGEISPLLENDVSRECKYCIVYDPRNPDSKHALLYEDVIKNLEHNITPYAGHPSGFVLRDTGALHPLVLSCLKAESGNWRKIYRQNRAQSSIYLLNLALELIRHSKKNWAKIVLYKAVLLDPLDAPCRVKLAELCGATGELNDAVLHASVAVALRPTQPDMNAVLATMLWRKGLRASAAHYADRAISIAPDAERFRRLRQQIDRVV